MERKQRLFLAACCRRIWPLITDERSRHCVEVAEKYAEGAASVAELQTAFEAAMAAYDQVRRTPDARAYCAALSATELARADFRHGFVHCELGAEAAAMALAHGPFSPGMPVEYEPIRRAAEEMEQAGLLRNFFGYPFPPTAGDEEG